jgi:hypothetical protein
MRTYFDAPTTFVEKLISHVSIRDVRENACARLVRGAMGCGV